MTSVSFFVPGRPRPGGSKRAFPLWRGKGASKQFIRTLITDASGTAGKQWREVIQWRAKEAMQGKLPFHGPLRARFDFVLKRPKSHFRKCCVAPEAPLYPVSKPDALKLARAAEDALTGIVWIDDSQVVIETITKNYADDEGVMIEVEMMHLDPVKKSMEANQ